MSYTDNWWRYEEICKTETEEHYIKAAVTKLSEAVTPEMNLKRPHHNLKNMLFSSLIICRWTEFQETYLTFKIAISLSLSKNIYCDYKGHKTGTPVTSGW